MSQFNNAIEYLKTLEYNNNILILEILMKRLFLKKASRRDVYQFISIIIFLSLVILGSVLLGPIIVKTANDPEQFRDFIKQRGVWGPITFIGIQMLQIIFAFIPGEVVEVGAGYAFGPWLGLLFCLIGVLFATLIIFYSTKTFGKRIAQSILENERINRLKFLNDPKKLETVMFILYFIPGTPKDVITYVAGLTKIRARAFIPISVLARIPSIITSTYVGHTLVRKDYIAAVLIFLITGAVGIAGIYIYHKFTERKNDNSKN